MSKALLGTRFRKEEEKGETGTIYIEPSGDERNIPWVAVETEISLLNLIVKLQSISILFEQSL
jgi:hypothetical protein